MSNFDKLAEVVGPLAQPISWESACLTWDKRDMVYVKHDGQAWIRVKPTGDAEIKLSANVSHHWLNTVGNKCGIAGVYQRRNLKHQSHREIVFKDGTTNMLIGEGEMMLTGKLKPMADKHPSWWEVQFELDKVPSPKLATVDIKAARLANVGIRKMWELHKVTLKMLADKLERPRYRYSELRWSRTARAKALLDLKFDAFLELHEKYGLVENAIKSCNLEIYQQLGCVSYGVESTI